MLLLCIRERAESVKSSPGLLHPNTIIRLRMIAAAYLTPPLPHTHRRTQQRDECSAAAPRERRLLQLLHRGGPHLRHRLSQAPEARVDVRNSDGVL